MRIPPPIIAALVDLHAHLTTATEPIPISDRRMRRGVQLLQVAAYLDGRDELIDADLLLLQHVLWHRPVDRSQVVQWLMGRLAHDLEEQQRTTHQVQGACDVCFPYADTMVALHSAL